MKMDLLNELLAKGYSVLFLTDHLISDFVTTETMEAFYDEIMELYPDPTDTTHFMVRKDTCLSTTSKPQPTNKPKHTTIGKNTHLTLLSTVLTSIPRK